MAFWMIVALAGLVAGVAGFMRAGTARRDAAVLREALKVRRWLDEEIAYPAPSGGQLAFRREHLIRLSKLTRAEIRKHLKET